MRLPLPKGFFNDEWKASVGCSFERILTQVACVYCVSDVLQKTAITGAYIMSESLLRDRPSMPSVKMSRRSQLKRNSKSSVDQSQNEVVK